MKSCVICGGPSLIKRLDYLSCQSCGHEALVSSARQTFIVNDPLEIENIKRTTSLDRFKNNAVRRWAGAAAGGVLVDFGSASGKFLHGNKSGFSSVIGVEVTPVAIEFSRARLQLDIRTSVDDLPGAVSLVTCWHSLEHVPLADIIGVVEGLSGRLSVEGRMIISVPNSDSLQYRLLRGNYAFYDVPNHHHQFSLRSLDLLMARVGLRRVKLAFSGIYNVFGWVQGLLNWLGGGHNYLYYRRKRRTGPSKPAMDVWQFCLLPVVILPAVFMTFLDFIIPGRQGVISVCYEKSPC